MRISDNLFAYIDFVHFTSQNYERKIVMIPTLQEKCLSQISSQFSIQFKEFPIYEPLKTKDISVYQLIFSHVQNLLSRNSENVGNPLVRKKFEQLSAKQINQLPDEALAQLNDQELSALRPEALRQTSDEELQALTQANPITALLIARQFDRRNLLREVEIAAYGILNQFYENTPILSDSNVPVSNTPFHQLASFRAVRWCSHLAVLFMRTYLQQCLLAPQNEVLLSQQEILESLVCNKKFFQSIDNISPLEHKGPNFFQGARFLRSIRQIDLLHPLQNELERLGDARETSFSIMRGVGDLVRSEGEQGARIFLLAISSLLPSPTNRQDHEIFKSLTAIRQMLENNLQLNQLNPQSAEHAAAMLTTQETSRAIIYDSVHLLHGLVRPSTPTGQKSYDLSLEYIERISATLPTSSLQGQFFLMSRLMVALYFLKEAKQLPEETAEALILHTKSLMLISDPQTFREKVIKLVLSEDYLQGIEKAYSRPKAEVLATTLHNLLQAGIRHGDHQLASLLLQNGAKIPQRQELRETLWILLQQESFGMLTLIIQTHPAVARLIRVKDCFPRLEMIVTVRGKAPLSMNRHKAFILFLKEMRAQSAPVIPKQPEESGISQGSSSES